MPDSLPCYIRAQNAGILIHRESETSVLFEFLEVSPSCMQVLKTKGRLIRRFPGSSVALPWDIIFHSSDRRDLCQFLHQIHVEEICKATKADLKVPESDHDSAHPFIVTELLRQILAVYGESRNDSCLIKRTHDDALGRPRRNPWRRSSFWLVLRVILQRSLQRTLPGEQGRTLYKVFMLYVMSAMAEATLQSEEDCDNTQIIAAKLARRRSKLPQQIPAFVDERCLNIVKTISTRSTELWLGLQRGSHRPVPNLRHIRVSEGDTRFELANNRALVAARLGNKKMSTASSTSNKKASQEQGRLKPGSFPVLERSQKYRERSTVLADLEEYVRDQLKSWSHQDRGVKDCRQLMETMEFYAFMSVEEYQGCPKAMSLTFLVLPELWVALDEICLNLYPLMQEYSPEIPTSLLDPLLLPKIEQLRRLQTIEAYLKKRHIHAKSSGNARIFADPTSTSFAVRYFDSSDSLKSWEKKILNQARTEREKKHEEWEKTKEIYDEYIAAAQKLSCECAAHDNPGDMECRRCKLISDAKALHIQSATSLVPKDDVELKAIVFELRCPPAIASWRDATWLILNDFTKRKPVDTSQKDTVKEDTLRLSYHKHKPLAEFLRPDSLDRRIELGSSKTPESRKKLFPVDFDSIYLVNSLEARYWDSKSKS